MTRSTPELSRRGQGPATIFGFQITTRRQVLPLAMAAVAAAAGRQAFAQDYPTRAVTMIVPTGPGGGMETLARIFGAHLEERLGKPFVIENRAGAGGIIATSTLARSNPDGHTLMVANSTNLAINVSLYKSLPYNPATDITPIIHHAYSPFILVGNPSLPVASVADLIKLAKAKPGRLSYGSAGPGTAHHLFAEMFRTQTGITVTHVPYKSTLQPLGDVAAGHMHFMFTDLPPAQGLIKEGKVRALGLSSKVRLAAAPEIPPLTEAGVPGFEALSWHMIVGPAGTPVHVVNKLHSELKAIAALPEVNQRIHQLGLIPVDSPPVEELRAFIISEIARWARIVQDAGATASQ
jgi:tripartite-type tricarboxylate transporter receptor subunit TctC